MHPNPNPNPNPNPIFSLLSTTTTTMPSSPSLTKPKHKPTTTTPQTTSNHHSLSSSTTFCHRHNHHSLSSATAGTLDLLILILVLFSGTFLLTSYFSYLFNSLSLLLPSFSLSPHLLPLLGFLLSFAAVVAAVFGTVNGTGFGLFRSRRKCKNPKCKGMKKALEFDLQLQSEECLKQLGNGNGGTNEIDKLPWKGGSEVNPDYECLRAELRKMAPINGRAVLLFRAKCGCPVAKLVGWGPKKGRKHKKSLANVATNGDHR